MGLGVAVLGFVVAVAPFLHWYRADLPGRDLRYRGVQVAGELLALPLLGAALVIAGAVVAGRPPSRPGSPSRGVGVVIAAAGAAAAVLALVRVLDIPAVAIPVGVPGGPDAPLDAQPIGLLAAAAGAAAAGAGLLWIRGGAETRGASAPPSSPMSS